jgi:membrane associated rhomboid family serine protease
VGVDALFDGGRHQPLPYVILDHGAGEAQVFFFAKFYHLRNAQCGIVLVDIRQGVLHGNLPSERGKLMNPFKRIQYNAPVTISFALLSLGVLLLAHFFGGQTIRLFFSVYRAPVTDPLMYVRIFGHVLGHADAAHYFNNFVIILLLGPMLEEKYGGRPMVLMMVITAVVTGLLFMAFSEHAMLGASGIVFMMILLSSFANWQKGRIPLTLVLVMVIFIGREVLATTGAANNVSHMTHIIGGVCGAVFGFVLNRR